MAQASDAKQRIDRQQKKALMAMQGSYERAAGHTLDAAHLHGVP